MTRKGNTRYPHAFSKGKAPGFHSQGSWRQGVGMGRPPPASLAAAAAGGAEPTGKGAGMTAPPDKGAAAKAPSPYPMTLDPRRYRYLKVSPTIANLYKSHMGVAVICADCCRGVGHRNPGLPDRFKRQWHLTLIEIEQKCRCGMCGSRNARVYPWAGDFDGPLGLEGPPEGGR